MYRRLRFCWIVECRTSSIIWIAWPLCSSGFGTAWNSIGIDRAAEISGSGMMRQEQLLPLQPALLHLAEHVAADGAVRCAVDAVVLLLLHREVGPQDLLERVLLRGLLERVVGAVLHVRLVVLRLPGQLLDLLVSLCHTSGDSSSPFPGHPGSTTGRRRRRMPRSAAPDADAPACLSARAPTPSQVRRARITTQT